jgi:alkanesulfonate monooxygenase SsuD/methylene tetrahydromethanopterin reductase-like flavin-dependent oxidoreductase (luciferase family)
MKKKIDIYPRRAPQCTQPLGKFVSSGGHVHDGGVRAHRRRRASDGAECFEWYRRSARQIAQSPSGWRSANRSLGTALRADMRAHSDDVSLDLLSLEDLVDTGACVLGTPDQCLDACKRYEAAGVDLLLCLVNPYRIGHEQVMQTIDLLGKHVIPQFS